MWEILAMSYQGMVRGNISNLWNTRRYFESLQMKDKENIDSFMNRVLTIVNQLNIYVDNIKDESMIEKALKTLSTKFDVVETNIEEAKDLMLLKIDKLMESLISHELRINQNKDSSI